MRLAIGIFFISIITINLFAQSTDSLPFFSEDLNAVSQYKKGNLKPNNKDVVRGSVVDFNVNTDHGFSIIENKPSTDISVSFWFLPKKLDIHSGTLISKKGVFNFRYLSNRQIQFNHFFKKDINTVSLLSNNIWQHIGFTLSKHGNLTIYYNGNPILKETISSDWWKHKNPELIIGNDQYGVKAEGSLDRLKVWNRTLSEKEFKKEFEVTYLQTNLYHKLETYLPLRGEFKDVSSKSKSIKTVEDVSFVHDSIKGTVASFNTDSSVLKIKNLNFKNQLTIAVWLKPKRKGKVIGIAGNKDFSFRYRPNTQSLWFNVPMMFKVVSTQPIRNIEDWVHLAVTVNYNDKIKFFINGELVDSKKIGGNTGKEDVLEVGKSLWGNTFNGQMSQFAVWSKVLSEREIKSVYEGKLEADRLLYNKTNNTIIYLLILVIVVSLVLFLIWFLQSQKSKKTTKYISHSLAYDFPQKNSLFLFDKFRAFDKNGNDISNEFTPTLIRLLSLILLFPRVTTRHISSSELSDILWEMDSVSQQKNNRGTNMHRLRKLLKSFDGISLAYQNRKWKFQISNELFIDVFFYKETPNANFINYPYKNLQLCKPLKITNFDNIILQMNEEHIEILKNICVEAFTIKDWKALRKGADLWLSIDSLSEIALTYQITALQNLNEKRLALNYYNSFASNYQLILNQKFHLPFEDCLL